MGFWFIQHRFLSVHLSPQNYSALAVVGADDPPRRISPEKVGVLLRASEDRLCSEETAVLGSDCEVGVLTVAVQ